MTEPTYRKIDHAARALKAGGITFESHDRGSHMVVFHNGLIVDFWPVTGKFSARDQRGVRHRPTTGLAGVEALLSYMGA